MITLPNGKSVDRDMLEMAMEDSDLANMHFLNLVTGEVVFFSEYLGLSEEDERLLEEIDGSNDYVAIERIPSHEAYQWMVDFVDEMVAPADEQAAEKLSIALNGRGAFRRFKDTYIWSMIDGRRLGISGEISNSKRLTMSGSRMF